MLPEFFKALQRYNHPQEKRAKYISRKLTKGDSEWPVGVRICSVIMPVRKIYMKTSKLYVKHTILAKMLVLYLTK